MKILALGGTGFIGGAAVRRLHARGHALALFHRGKTGADLPTGIEQIHGDRANLTEFRAQFAALRPDVVLDTLCMTEAQAQAVRETFVGVAGRLVTLSSCDVYRAYDLLLKKVSGPLEPVPLSEASPVRDRLYPFNSEYEKILVERVALAEPNLPATVLRLPAVYGPRDRQHRIFADLKRMVDGRPAILLDRALAGWRWSRGYVENVAEAIALAVTDDRARGQVYNVADADTQTQAEWVAAIGRAASWPGRVVTLPRDRVPAHLHLEIETAQHLVMDTSRIRRDLGYVEPVGLEEALRATVAWQRANPPAQFDPASFDYAAEDAALIDESA